jgi:hypothetical protein
VIFHNGEKNLKARSALGALEDGNRAPDGADVVAYESESETRSSRNAPVVGGTTAKESLEYVVALF